MGRIILLFIMLLTFPACDPETPISSSSEENQSLKESLLHPKAGPVPILEQASQLSDSSIQNNVLSLNSSEVSSLTPASASTVSLHSALTKDMGGITEADTEKNEVVTKLAVLDKEVSSPPQANELQTGETEEETSTTQVVQPPSILESIPQLTFEQIFNSDFVTNRMGGSNPYKQYMADTLVYVNNDLLRTDKKAREEFAFLCDEPFCSKGLKNVNSLSANDMARMLYKLGEREDIWHIAPLNTIVLQGTVTGKSEFEKLAKKLDQIAKTYEIDSLWINLSHPWDHLDFMLELGRFIRDNRVNLRIIGRCSGPCPNYIIPATYQVSKVIMEPGGNIFTGGGYVELYREMRDRFPDNTMALKRRFDETYFPQGNRKGVREILHNVNASVVHFILSGPLALNGLNRFLSNRHKTAWEELSEDEKSEFLSHIPESTVIEMKNRAFVQSSDHQAILRAKSFLDHLKNLAHKEENYYKALNTPAGELYAYSDLIRLTTALVKQPVYEEYFIVNRKTPFPETYTSNKKAVVLSTNILRQSGINIQGKHHREILESIYGDPEAFLILNDQNMHEYF